MGKNGLSMPPTNIAGRIVWAYGSPSTYGAGLRATVGTGVGPGAVAAADGGDQAARSVAAGLGVGTAAPQAASRGTKATGTRPRRETKDDMATPDRRPPYSVRAPPRCTRAPLAASPSLPTAYVVARTPWWN